MALSLAALNPQALESVAVPDPAKRFKTLADARGMMQQETLRTQAIQENEAQSQAQKAALQKASQVHDILAKSGGKLTPEIVDSIFAVDQNAGAAFRKMAADEAKAAADAANIQADNARADKEFFERQIVNGANQKHQKFQEGLETRKQDEIENQGAFQRMQSKPRSSLHPDTMLVNGKAEDVLKGIDPDDASTFQKVFLRGQDVTGNASHYEKPLAPKEPKLAPDLESATSTTRSGLRYVDTSQFTGEARNALTEAANKAGISPVSKEIADMLSEIDTARANLDYMNQTIAPFLAKDLTGRLYSVPANTIEKLAQSNPDLAAIGTYRSAAIQAMRAVAGAKGLRINRAEIEQAQENDIPKMTDTLPVAQKKLQNMLKFLDNAEKAHIVRDRSGGTNVNIDDIINRVFPPKK